MNAPLLPPTMPASRMLGLQTVDRRKLLACIDVVVGYVSARHRLALRGWHIEAALVDARADFRGGETVALRAFPELGVSPADLPPVPNGVLREMASRMTAGLEGIANVVPDVACVAPDIEGSMLAIDDDWNGAAATA